jgi:parallel beta helix pectate lyase-like protein
LRIVRRTLTLALMLGTTTLAEAQASRTWVSGVGDDANPCSRTAPCKTFAGAISRTAPNGEINVLDPGGYGTVTITKSISIVADGNIGGILAAGTNGVIVNAAGAVVVLRGLDINGFGTGLNGIRFLAGSSLTVENCQIYGFTGKGIDMEPSTAARLLVSDTAIRNNVGVNAGGILLAPTVTGSVAATLERVRMDRNRFGLRVEDRARAAVRKSTASGNEANGFRAVSTGDVAQITIDDTLASDNNTAIGAQGGGTATVRMSHMVVTGNATGVSATGGSAIISYGNNRIADNTVDGAPTFTIGEQ